MSFNFVAPYYRSLETIVFGNGLQRARTCWIEKITRPKRTLILGEGNGRFLCELVRAHPGIDIDCIDASDVMLKIAQARLRRISPESVPHVHFSCADISKWLPQKSYDLLVTHFFLDCFPRKELPAIVRKLANAAQPGAAWLIADFTIPRQTFPRICALFLLQLMYTFFRATAGIAARKLVDPTPYLNDSGFCRTSEKLYGAGLIRSDLYLLDQPG